MDIILLNEEFKNEEYVDTHESFIWREAFFGGDGDFELTMSKADSDASPMAIGRILTHSETNRMCVIDTLEEEEDDEGVVMSTWKGVDFTRWVFSRRVVQRTVMPTYSWSKAPHNSVSIETFKGSTTGRNNFINPHFLVGDKAEPHLRRSSPFADDSVTGNLRVGNGVVALTGVTTDNGGQRGYGYKMARQPIPAGHRFTQYTFSITVEDVNLSPGGRIQVYIEFYNANYVLIPSMTSYMPGIYADGRYRVTTPTHTFAPSFYDVYFIIDNRETTAHPSIQDCSATFHSPVLNGGTAQGRFFAGDMSYLMLHPERKFSGTPTNIMHNMINVITRNNTDTPNDNFYTLQWFPPGLDGYLLEPKNPTPVETVDLYFGAVSLYDALLSIGETYDLGVSIMRDSNNSSILYVYAHGGTDRRSRIVYDPSTDTLDNPSSVDTTRDHRTHAVVYGKYDFVITDAAGSTTDHEGVAGYNRELLVVDANDVDLPHGTEELYSVLIQRGREALNEHQRVSGIDGEVPSHVEYKYQRDFGLGSMVTVRNDNGGEAEMRVTEYIFVSDAEGVRSYPTLSKNRYIDPGTWGASRPGEIWQIAEGYWEDR